MRRSDYGLEARPDGPDWRHLSACRDTDPDLFYGETAAEKMLAKRVCAACPVQTKCLAEAMEQRDYFGVQGGRTGEERRIFATRGYWPQPGQRCAECRKEFKPRRHDQTACRPCLANRLKEEIPQSLYGIELAVRELRGQGWSQRRIAGLYGYRQASISAACRLWGIGGKGK